MTEPAAPLPTHDPTTAILIAVTRMDGKLDAALDKIARHDTEISEHRVDIATLKVDVAELKTVGASDDRYAARAVSARAAFWTGLAALVALTALIVGLYFRAAGKA